MVDGRAVINSNLYTKSDSLMRHCIAVGCSDVRYGHAGRTTLHYKRLFKILDQHDIALLLVQAHVK